MATGNARFLSSVRLLPLSVSECIVAETLKKETLKENLRILTL